MELEYVFIEFEAESDSKGIQKILDNVNSLCHLFGFPHRILDNRNGNTYVCFEIAYPRYHFVEADYAHLIKTFALLNNCSYLRSYVRNVYY